MNPNKYLPILKYHAKRVFENIKHDIPIPYDDCLGEAFVIFMHAVEKYDPSRNVKFSTLLYAYLKNLKRQVLLTNRMSSEAGGKFPHPTELTYDVPDNDKTLPLEELSNDGRLVVTLVTSSLIFEESPDYPIRKKELIKRYMKRHYEWSGKKTESVMEEITDWWRSIS